MEWTNCLLLEPRDSRLCLLLVSPSLRSHLYILVFHYMHTEFRVAPRVSGTERGICRINYYAQLSTVRSMRGIGEFWPIHKLRRFVVPDILPRIAVAYTLPRITVTNARVKHMYS